MEKWKKELASVAVLALYLIGTALIGFGLYEIWRPIAFVFCGGICVYVGNCVFRLLEDKQ